MQPSQFLHFFPSDLFRSYGIGAAISSPFRAIDFPEKMPLISRNDVQQVDNSLALLSEMASILKRGWRCFVEVDRAQNIAEELRHGLDPPSFQAVAKALPLSTVAE
jgi:hypothetical protein